MTTCQITVHGAPSDARATYYPANAKIGSSAYVAVTLSVPDQDLPRAQNDVTIILDVAKVAETAALLRSLADRLDAVVPCEAAR